MTTVLGLHYGHSGTACIVRDGKLIAALSRERTSRNKHEFGVDDELLDYLFAYAGIKTGDIDYIALSDWHPDHVHHDIKVTQNGKEANCLWNTIFDNNHYRLDVEFRGESFQAFHIGHQLSHVASAFYTSPFEEAYCFAMDASGGYHKSNSVVAYGHDRKLTSLYCPGLMVGVAYGFFTEYIGIGPQILKAGSTMALAGYGSVLPKVKDDLPSYVDGCFFPDDKDYHRWYDTELWKDLAESRIILTRRIRIQSKLKTLRLPSNIFLKTLSFNAVMTLTLSQTLRTFASAGGPC